MDFGLLLRGLVIGFSIAAPVGPIGVLVIRRTLSRGWHVGLVSGLGAASADAVYGVIAAFGLTVISSFLIGNQVWLRVVGGFFLCYLGIKTFFSRESGRTAAIQSRGLMGAYTSIFVLTLTNPMTILSFTAIFAGLGLGQSAGDPRNAALLVVGVFSGSAAWWLLLSGLVGTFRRRIDERILLWVNRLAGVVILVFGVWALVGVFTF
jgi:threonine/homoserine/homoserine lactone efflux protein